jgi:tripartite-type tricarboxylate transporter receptor subunit TctC
MSLRTILNGVTLAAFAVGATMAMGPTKAVADYPNDKTVLALVPFGAGGGTDRWARVMSSVGFDFFGRGLRVQNRGGAGGTVGWKHMLSKGPDGHTVILGSPTPVLAALAEKKPPFDPGNVKIVAYYSVMKTTLMSPKGKPYDTWDGFVKHLKSSNKKVSIGATMTHLLGVVQALKELKLDKKVILVNYSGTGKAMNDYIGNHIDMIALTTSTAIGMMQKHNAIFNASGSDYPKKQKKKLGNVPNAKTLGLTPYEPPRFFAMHPDTPDAQVKIMSEKLGKLLKAKPVKKLIGKLGEVITFLPQEKAAVAYKDVLKLARDNISLLK